MGNVKDRLTTECVLCGDLFPLARKTVAGYDTCTDCTGKTMSKMNESDWKQELFDFIIKKSKEHQATPRNAYEYFNLMAQLAIHEAKHAEIRMRDEPEDKCTKDDGPIMWPTTKEKK